MPILMNAKASDSQIVCARGKLLRASASALARGRKSNRHTECTLFTICIKAQKMDHMIRWFTRVTVRTSRGACHAIVISLRRRLFRDRRLVESGFQAAAVDQMQWSVCLAREISFPSDTPGKEIGE
jgi:hypothetical protein